MKPPRPEPSYVTARIPEKKDFPSGKESIEGLRVKLEAARERIVELEEQLRNVSKQEKERVRSQIANAIENRVPMDVHESLRLADALMAGAIPHMRYRQEA